jgi:hypothetical protein
MVGRLVQEEDVRLHRQRGCQHRPAELTAGHLGCLLLRVHAQARQVPFRRHRINRRRPVGGPRQGTGGAAGACGGLLAQIRDTSGAVKPPGAAVGRIQAGDYPEKSAFPGTVSPDQTEPVAGFQGQRNVFKQIGAPVAEGDILECDQCHIFR